MGKMLRIMRCFAAAVACVAAPAAQAQIVETSALPAVAVCTVTDTAPAEVLPGGAGMLMAACGNTATLLGPAAAYSATTNAANGSVLVVRQRGGRTVVLLVSPTAGGSGVHVDDITRDLAQAGGRGGDLGLGAMTVDVLRFATDGSVGISGGGAAKRLDLAGYVGRAAAMPTATAVTTTKTANP